MKSKASTKFWKFYYRLPLDLQKQARKSYQLWKVNPYHPGLHFKKVSDNEPIYSVRVSDNYRALGYLVEKDTIVWFWIGDHKEYERLLK